MDHEAETVGAGAGVLEGERVGESGHVHRRFEEGASPLSVSSIGQLKIGPIDCRSAIQRQPRCGKPTPIVGKGSYWLNREGSGAYETVDKRLAVTIA